MAMDKETIKKIQSILGTDADGVWGPKSQAALDAWTVDDDSPKAKTIEIPMYKKAPVAHDLNNNYMKSLLNKMDNGGTMYNYNVAKDLDPNMVIDDFSAPELNVKPNRNAARIAEITQRLEEIQKEKARLQNGGLEEAMGKYKYLYDADPSTYMQYKQNLRTAEQTEKIRKATEDATKASNLQSQWKQNGIDMEVANYDLAAAQNEFKNAQGNNDSNGMQNALLKMKQAQAKKNRLSRENDILRSKLFKDLEVGEVKDNTDYSEYEKGIAGADDVSKLQRAVEATKKSIAVDNVSIKKEDKAKFVEEKTAELDEQEAAIKNSPLSEDNKTKLLAIVEDSRKALKDYGKPSGKGGQGVKLTKEDYGKKILLNGQLRNQTALVALGEKTLKDAKAFYPEYAAQLDAAINEAVMQKK